ncbi:MAG TPA: putative inorganic carbon transporter subunit DabA, partial [Cyclobacteriaceae bacterium]|nr:putative inorganic carbon transporter subunit DabA [Cyclobacteriaceae bacterium]
ITELLKILIGDESLFKQYLFDQQFAHQGWSGMVSAIEDHPETLLDQRDISLQDLIIFELLLEIDALDFEFGEIWAPLSHRLSDRPPDLFENITDNEQYQMLFMLHEAFEWTYYDEVLAAMKHKETPSAPLHKSFQAMFCLDDRACSFRRSVEKIDRHCETFGTPGFFGVEFYFQPEDGKFYTKVCPAPINPKHLVKEIGKQGKYETDIHFVKHSRSFIRGWLISQTLGFWSAFKLFLNVFRPTMSPATASSFRHMDKVAKLTIENKSQDDLENGLQIGFTIEEMAQRVEELLMSIGLIKDFAPLVYVVGHGSSSVNNPHFAAYDCGACAGRPGSVNARVISFMANHNEVRKILHAKGIHIPDQTTFVGALHDTTRDEIVFYDEDKLTSSNSAMHQQNKNTFLQALDINAKERSRRFESINTKLRPEKIHDKVRRRSVSLFEPRPELNHATNALCIIGRRSLTKNLFLDRRAFLNSYDFRIDPDGRHLLNILRQAAPVCGGINLEYFFSRVDNQKLGAGTKLPHNVMGLFGVANGIDGDLRPGLPSQMIEVHDPLRLLVIVEHFSNVVSEIIRRSPETYEWFRNEWLNLAVVEPDTKMIYIFRDGNFHPYDPLKKSVNAVDNLNTLFETHHDNLPVYVFHNNGKGESHEHEPAA